MNDVAVVGVGAIGGVVAARLSGVGRLSYSVSGNGSMSLPSRGRDGILKVTPPVDVLRRPDVAEVARGRAEGAVLEEDLADEIVGAMIRGPEGAGTSMSPSGARGGRSNWTRDGAVMRSGSGTESRRR